MKDSDCSSMRGIVIDEMSWEPQGATGPGLVITRVKGLNSLVKWQILLFELSSKGCFQKKSALLTTSKPLTVWITTNCGTFFKRWEYQTPLPASWEICIQVKKQQLEPDMEQQTSSKSGKEYVKAVYCHPAYLTYVQSTSWEMPGWITHKLESGLLGEISITSDMQMTPSLWQKAKKN